MCFATNIATEELWLNTINETLTNLEFTIKIPSVSIDSLSNSFLT